MKKKLKNSIRHYDLHQCDNCRAIWEFRRLDDIKDLEMRVDEGGPEPTGQCPYPDCGALCYPYEGKTS